MSVIYHENQNISIWKNEKNQNFQKKPQTISVGPVGKIPPLAFSRFCGTVVKLIITTLGIGIERFLRENEDFYRKILCSSYLCLKYKNDTILTPGGSSFTRERSERLHKRNAMKRLHKQDFGEDVKKTSGFEWRAFIDTKAWREVLRLRSTKNKSRPMAAWISGGG